MRWPGFGDRNRSGRPARSGHSPPATTRAPSTTGPLPGVEVAIRDRGGTDELIVTGPHQFHGYLDATHNANTFDGDWVRTGDQADIDDADCLRIRV